MFLDLGESKTKPWSPVFNMDETRQKGRKLSMPEYTPLVFHLVVEWETEVGPTVHLRLQ